MKFYPYIYLESTNSRWNSTLNSIYKEQIRSEMSSLFQFRKSEFNKPGYQFRQVYLQQINKSKKKKKKKEVKDMFSSDSDDDDGKSRRSVTKQVDHIVHGITYCVVTLNLPF